MMSEIMRAMIVISLMSIIAYSFFAVDQSVASSYPSESKAQVAIISTRLDSPAPASVCTWIVAPNGSSRGNGSAGKPWSLETLFGGNPSFGGTPPPTVIQPGDTICLRGGTYSGSYRTYLLGTSSAQITVQPYPGEQVTIDGGGITIDGGGYLTIRDIEMTNSDPNRKDYRAGGFNVAAPGIKLINNIIHDGGAAIVSNDSGFDDEFYGNVIYNVGWDDRKSGLGQGGTGPAMYTENQKGFKKVYENIITNGFGYGIHAYVGGNAHLINFDVQGNVSYDNGYWTRIKDSSYASEGRTTSNYLFGAAGTPVVNLTFKDNFGYHREQRGGMNLELGYGRRENTSAVIKNNTLVGGSNSIARFETLDFEGNFIASFWEVLSYIAPTTVVKQLIDGNTYYFFSPDCATPFGLGPNDTPLSVVQWRAKGFDVHSSFLPCGTRPSGVKVSVRPNAYDSNRAHIIINNYAKRPTVSIDLSAVLRAGDSFEIRNAQDYFSPPVLAGTYTGGAISVLMTNLTVARPIGWTGSIIPSSAPEFGAFILLKK